MCYNIPKCHITFSYPRQRIFPVNTTTFIIIDTRNVSLEQLRSSVASFFLFIVMLFSELHCVCSNNHGLATMDFAVLWSLDSILPSLKLVSLLVNWYNKVTMTHDH